MNSNYCLIDYFYKLNVQSSRVSNSHLLFFRFARFFIRFLANILLPFYFILFPDNKKKYKNNNSNDLIVSLTSFPDRIAKVWITVESILRQTYVPNKIILWLSLEQFPNKEGDLPRRLLEQRERGLDICFVHGDIKSYKKFYYSFVEFPQSKILTIDDDIIFPSFFIKDIVNTLKNHPTSIIANFGFRYKWDKDKKKLSKVEDSFENITKGKNLFFGSGGGTLFQPCFFSSFMSDVEPLMSICPTADDIFLNGLAKLAGIDVVFVKSDPLLSIMFKKDLSLVNINGGITDEFSHNTVQLRKFVDYCLEKYGKNPFE